MPCTRCGATGAGTDGLCFTCYKEACDALSARILAASRAGATGREIDRVYAQGMRDLGAPEAEVIRWMGMGLNRAK